MRSNLINSWNKTTRSGRFIVVLLCVLPLVDTLNGVFPEVPVGKIYKMSLGIIVFLYLIAGYKKLNKKYTAILLGAILYIVFSVSINVLLGGTILNIEYPLKLIFNILLIISLIQCVEYKLLSGHDFYFILDFSSWLFIACYLIPYVMGTGNRVYEGEIGYKGFFIAQNELGLVVVVFCFFTAYQLIHKIRIVSILKLALLFVCGMLLNTKTSIIACLIAIAMWFVPIVLRGKAIYKILSVVALFMGIVLFKETLFKAVSSIQYRYSVLTTKYYDGSVLTGLLSGRNSFVQLAWQELRTSHSTIRFLIGNGFCSEVLTEMDIIDIFFYLGSLGAIFVLTALYIFWRKTIQNAKYDLGRIRVVSILVIFALMFFAGHVLFMAMSGCYFIIYLCFLFYYKETNISKKAKGRMRI